MNVLVGVLLALLVAIGAVEVARQGRRAAARRHIQRRPVLDDEELHALFHDAGNREAILEACREVAALFSVQPGQLRPEDRITELTAQLRRREVARYFERIAELVRERGSGSVELNGVGDLVRILVERRAQGRSASASTHA